MDAPPTESDGRHARILLALVSLMLVFLTLRPFAFSLPSAAQVREAVLLDAAMPLHIASGWVLMVLVRSAWPVTPRRAALIVLGGLVCLEAVQPFVENRHARIGDVAAQAIGVWLGSRVRLRHIKPLRWRVAWSALLALWIIGGATLGIRGQFGHTLGPMDDTFRLVVADEYGGGRPWLGEVHGFAVSTDAGDGPSVAFGEPPESGTWQGKGPLQLALERDGSAWSSVLPATDLCRALDAAHTIGVTLDITPASLDQTGPARIVSVSKGLELRNLTVGQEGDALVLRIRTPRSGRNASRPEYRFLGVIEPGERRRYELETDGGSATLTVDGERVATRVQHVSPVDWCRLRPPLGDAIGSAAMFVPIGLALGGLASLRGRGVRVGVLIAAAIAPMLVIGPVWGVAAVRDRPVMPWVLVVGSALSAGACAWACSVRGRGRGSG
ncbi:MAG: hypothetical protein AAFR96_04040 [Planctomycetota bacterium]